ncbi:unnamed protein product [Lactuca saligna]|uniref:Uncharacterized protein n=1 Tax=Lactuca saligna TaxID=75948 RepID=A0AA35VD03_LACSI|nr:unnamed protein product [Lactuca saligna]
MPVSPSPIAPEESSKEEPFEEQEPLEEDEAPERANEEGPIDSSPYSDSSSSDDPTYYEWSKVQVEECTTLEIGLEPLQQVERAASPPLSPIASKILFLAYKWTPQIEVWIMEDSIRVYEVRESSQEPLQDPIPESPTDWAISVLVPRVARHANKMHCTEDDLFSLRMEVRLLTNRVYELR